MLSVALLSTAILICLFYNWWNPKNLPPGPKNWLGVGAAVKVWGTNLRFPHLAFIELAKNYGDIMYVSWGVHDTIVINKFEDMKELLTKHEFHARYEFDYLKDRAFGRELGLLFSSNKLWSDMRRFSQKQLSNFALKKSEILGNAIKDEFLDFAAAIEQSAERNSGLITIDCTFDKTITNILWRLLFGFESEECLKKVYKVTEANEKLMKTFSYKNLALPYPCLRKIFPRLTDHYNNMKLFKHSQDTFRELIEESRKRQTIGEVPLSFVQAFTAKIHENLNVDASHFTDDNLLITLLDIFLAGTETLSRFFDYAILYLVIRPDVQEKILEEIYSIYPDGGVLILSDSDKMPYTRAVILETLRLANIIPMPTPRRVIVDYVYKGYHFPKGACIAFNLVGALRDPTYWGNDVDKFSPERFINPVTGGVIKTDRVPAFGFGKRSCLGETVARQSAFIYLTGLIQKFKFSQAPNSPTLEHNSLPGFTSRPHPFDIAVAKRH